jgi:3-oxoacyl-[acyl-carrier protein] reductase
MNLLRDKVALITGANRGIGKAIAEKFAANGAGLVLHARTKESLDSFADQLKQEYNVQIITTYFDLADYSLIKQAFKNLFPQLKQLDILVNNAGILEASLIGMTTDVQVERLFRTNTFGPVYTCQYSSRLMSRSGGGSIVNISSIMGTQGFEGHSVYSATKAALIGLTKSLSKELASQNIRVNAIAPGFIDTDMTRIATPEKYNSFLSTIKLARIGSAEDVANAALFLASDLSSYITGHTLDVDGGMSL